MRNENLIRKSKFHYKWKSYLQTILSYTFLILLSSFIIIPFYVIFITSVKSRADSLSIPFTWLPSQGWHFDGYFSVLFSDLSGGGDGTSTIIRGFMNTLIVVIPSTLIGLLTSALSAYAFAKLKFKGKKIGFGVLLVTMMIPGVIMLVPSYMVYDALGLVDSFFPLMVPGMFGAAAAVFFLRQFFQGIPDELLEAATIDGMGELGIFFKIMLPLSKPALIAQGILGFIAGYNDYFGPLIYLHDPKKYTLQIALSYFEGTYVNDWPTVMAGAVITLVPTIVIFLIAQKYFVQGITMTGFK
ncbi:carbohydrate ABC transporter permease [Acholeplasma granularum]|uniref:carbohydrate ABC transporter permease n=1 Tax=Acholeplasma granularum TaxID=264635 RepID=UPI0004714E8A|nr:carbohydrate ABC transporter permease [Acholeplasma granularum]